MNRVGEYIRFGVLYSGVGYVALWSLTLQGDGPALRLSPGLHLAGMIASACVLVALVLYPLQRRKRARAIDAALVPLVPQDVLQDLPQDLPQNLPQPDKANAPPPCHHDAPRAHFGLRNAQH